MARAFDIRVPAAPDEVIAALARDARLLDDAVLEAPRFHAWLPVSSGLRQLEAVARGSVDVGRDGSTRVRGHLSVPDPDQTLGTLLVPAAIAIIGVGWTVGSVVAGAIGALLVVAAVASRALHPSEEQAVAQLQALLGSIDAEEPEAPQLCLCHAG